MLFTKPISFSQQQLTSHTDIANAFCRQFTSISERAQDPRSRKLIRDIRRAHPLDHDTPNFTTEEVMDAIKRAGTSTSAGPDTLIIHHLRNPGPSALLQKSVRAP